MLVVFGSLFVRWLGGLFFSLFGISYIALHVNLLVQMNAIVKRIETLEGIHIGEAAKLNSRLLAECDALKKL